MITRTMIDPKDGVVEPEAKPWIAFNYGETFRPNNTERCVYVRVHCGALRLEPESTTVTKELTIYGPRELKNLPAFGHCVLVTGYAETIEIRSD